MLICIVLATDLTPSDTARLDPTQVISICTTLSSATSHGAIMARTLGIPAVLGVDCDRDNPRVANLADALQPAVLRMIQQTVQAAHAANIWVGLCGEMAADTLDTLITPILLGLGLDELSVNPQSVAPLKQEITNLNMAQAQAMALGALKQDSATSVRVSLRIKCLALLEFI
jgi:phosphoenolpyruvate-protein kinase (PTS system EI component)